MSQFGQLPWRCLFVISLDWHNRLIPVVNLFISIPRWHRWWCPLLIALFVFLNLLELFCAVHPSDASSLKPLRHFFFFFLGMLCDALSKWLRIHDCLKSIDAFKPNELFFHASNKHLTVHGDLDHGSDPLTVYGIECFDFFSKFGA